MSLFSVFQDNLQSLHQRICLSEDRLDHQVTRLDAIEKRCNDLMATANRQGSLDRSPIAVSERWPSAERGELDGRGRAWFYDPFVCPGWLLLKPDESTRGTHWLPHWAFPVPWEQRGNASG